MDAPYEFADLVAKADGDDPASPGMQNIAIARMLVSIMMIGQTYGMTDEAKAIFHVAVAMLGNARSLSVSLALASAMGGDTQPARDLLDGDLPDWPDAEPARISIALALRLGGAPEWAALCEHVLSVSVDEDTRRFARQVQDMEF